MPGKSKPAGPDSTPPQNQSGKDRAARVTVARLENHSFPL